MAGKLTNFISWIPEALAINIKVIVIHDQLDEETERELRTLADSYDFQLVTGKYGSPGIARNAGLTLAATEWIAFWDSDDRPHPREFLEMVTSASNSDKKWAVGSFCWKNEKTGLKYDEVISSNRAIDIFVNPGIWRFAFKKEIIKSTFSQHKLGEDQLFLSKIALNKEPGISFENVVYEYSHGGSGHLVDDVSKLPDLLDVMQRELSEMDSNFATQDNFARLFYIKQSLTLLRKGNIKIKLKTLVLLLQSTLYRPQIRFKDFWIVLQAISSSKKKLVRDAG